MVPWEKKDTSWKVTHNNVWYWSIKVRFKLASSNAFKKVSEEARTYFPIISYFPNPSIECIFQWKSLNAEYIFFANGICMQAG